MKVRSPFDGYPKTNLETIKGEPTYCVTVEYTMPWARIVEHYLSIIVATSLLYEGLVSYKTNEAYTTTEMVIHWGLPVIVYFMAKWTIRDVLRCKAHIRLSQKYIQIRRLGRWITYDRLIEHNFGLLEHDKTKLEQQQFEYQSHRAAKRGEVIPRKELYANSFHVVFAYMGQRNDLLTAYGHKEAQAIVNRLLAIDKRLDRNHAAMGADFKPDDQWNDGPGDIDGLDLDDLD